MMPSTWGRVLRGDIKLSKHLETGRTVLGQLAGAPRRASRRVVTPRAVARDSQPPLLTRIEGLFDQLRDRDQRATLLFTGAEVLRREMTEQGMLDRLERWPNLELALMGTDADTHTLTPPWLQQQVHELLDRVLIEELGRVTGS
jgi:hypothetical protein